MGSALQMCIAFGVAVGVKVVYASCKTRNRAQGRRLGVGKASWQSDSRVDVGYGTRTDAYVQCTTAVSIESADVHRRCTHGTAVAVVGSY